jgi:hypothetical protein
MLARAAAAPDQAGPPRHCFAFAAPAAAYVGSFALMLYPWIAAAPEAVAAGHDPRDMRLVIWLLWWIYSALAAGGSVFDAPIFYPAPGQLTGSEHFLSAQVLFAPAYTLTGNPLLAANIAALVSYPIAALAMNRFLVAVGCAPLAGWVGGLVFALGPLRVPGSLQILQYANLYLPLCVLACEHVLRRPDPLRAALLLGAVTLALFSSYYLAVQAVLCVALWLAIRLVWSRQHGFKGFAIAIACVLLATLALAAFSQPYFVRKRTLDLETAASAVGARTDPAPAPSAAPRSISR